MRTCAARLSRRTLSSSVSLFASTKASPVSASAAANRSLSMAANPFSEYRAVVVDRFGGTDVLNVKTMTPLAAPGPNQVIVDIYAAGVNPVDTYIRSGQYAAKPALPYTPGKDGAGVVVAIGPGVACCSVGSRVYLSGTVTGSYAERALCLESHVHPLPDCISFDQGAALGTPAFTAYRALFQKGGARPGQTVLVHGASGAVGLCCVQMAKARGLTVIGTASTVQGLAAVRECGAHFELNHKSEGYMQKILEYTGGQGVDIIIEMLANINLDTDLKALAVGGRVCVVGNRGRIEIDPRDLMSREASVVGVMLPRTTPQEIGEIVAAVGTALENGSLKPRASAAFAMDSVADAHTEVIEHKMGTTGNIVLRTRPH